jgi:hypothetical protein
MKLIYESYSIDKIKKLVLKYYIKYYWDKNGGYGISNEQQKAFATEDAIGHMDYWFDDSDYAEVADFLNSITFPVTVYRGIKVSDPSKITTGAKSGTHWTIDPNYILNQTNLLPFTHVMIGQFDEKDVNLENTVETYLHYSLEDNKRRMNRHREMEIWTKQRKEPKNLQVMTIDEFRDQFG